jgi:hypothetical protein
MTKTLKSVPITLAGAYPLVETTSDYFIPLCPKCGETYLHQSSVHIYTRDTEDALVGPVTFCDGTRTMVTQDGSMDNNPSRRRHGLSVDMDCEVCGPVGRLTIAQHKGQTLIGWQK